jgi:hypothetical protein
MQKRRVEPALVVVGVVVLLFVGYLASLGLAFRNYQGLRAVWTEEGELALRSISDGPFVVTHLQLIAGKESNKAVAAIDPPLAIMDSHGAVMTAGQLKALKWVDILGRPAPPPPVGAPISAWFYRPDRTETPSKPG